jgi:hypothetical protein
MLQPLEHHLHLVAIEMPRQQHELLLELGLIERTLRGSHEIRHPPRHLAPVTEPDRHRRGRILATLARRPGASTRGAAEKQGYLKNEP